MRHVASILFIGCVVLGPAAWAAGQPSGEGDPAAITCMRREKVTGSLRVPPPICKTNAEWAQLKADKLALAPDGSHAIATDDPRNIGAQVCQRAGPVTTMGPSRPGADPLMSQGFNITCN